jgi:hypothetical protein
MVNLLTKRRKYFLSLKYLQHRKHLTNALFEQYSVNREAIDKLLKMIMKTVKASLVTKLLTTASLFIFVTNIPG